VFVFESDAPNVFHSALNVDCPHGQFVERWLIDIFFESNRMNLFQHKGRKLLIDESHLQSNTAEFKDSGPQRAGNIKKVKT
jgi:hypothetical protein